MKKTLLTGIAALFLATGTAHAGSIRTDIWVKACTAKEAAGRTLCMGYALGLYDGLILWYANSKDPIKICVPEKPFVSGEQLKDIGLGYIRKHPDSNSRPIAVVLREALEEAFPLPCSEM